MDLSKLSDAELMAAAGGGAPAGPDLSKMSDADLLRASAQKPQPSIKQTLAASPIGRMVHDTVRGASDLANMAFAPRGTPNVLDATGLEGRYQGAIQAQQNRPGYLAARTQADQMNDKAGPGLAEQFMPGVDNLVQGIGGLVTGGVTGMSAAQDSRTASQNAYRAENPNASMAANIAGGFMMSPKLPGAPAAIPKQVAPTLAQLNADKKAAYAIVDNSPMRISAKSIDGLHADLQTKLGRMGLTEKTMPKLAPKVDAALESLKDAAAADQTMQAMEIQRRIAGIAAGSPDKTERAAARIVQDGIDDLIGNLTPAQLSGPIDPAAIAAIPKARELASRSFKAEQLQKMFDKAKNNASGFGQSGLENSIRSEFRKLVNNERGFSRFSKPEQEAIKQVATGGKGMSLTNTLRQIGKLSPQGAIPLISEIGLVMAAGPGALALPAIGFAGRMGATALQKGAAKEAINLAALGKTATPVPRQPLLSAPRPPSLSQMPYGLLGPSLQPQNQ